MEIGNIAVKSSAKTTETSCQLPRQITYSASYWHTTPSDQVSRHGVEWRWRWLLVLVILAA